MDTAKAAETRRTRGRNEGTATADNFEQGQRVLVDLSAFNGHDGTALGTVHGADDYGRVVSAQWVREREGSTDRAYRRSECSINSK